MNSILILNSSGRTTRSITRRLTDRFAQGWLARHPQGRAVWRDLTENPPPVVNESWIAAAFADPSQRSAPARQALRASEDLIEELAAASLIVIGAPVYNFGMPAQLKAYIDQVVRVGRTFAFEPGKPDPYRPLLEDRPVIVITSAGDGAILPGGALAHMNYLEPHLRTALLFIGLSSIEFVRVGYDEFGDNRFKHSLAAAEAEVDRWVDRTAGREDRARHESVPVPTSCDGFALSTPGSK